MARATGTNMVVIGGSRGGGRRGCGIRNGARVLAGARQEASLRQQERADAPWTAHSIQLLAIEHDMISAVTLFYEPAGSRLFQRFGLPLTVPHAASAEWRFTPHRIS